MKLASPQVQLWWSQRVLREKLLVTAAGTMALLGLGHTLITAPLEKKLRNAQSGTQALQAQAADLLIQRTQGAEQTRGLREQEQIWRDRLAAAQKAAAEVQRRAADAGRLPETLRAVVATVGAAELLELDLSGDADASAGAPATAMAPAAGGTMQTLYKLPITLKVRGPWAELNTVLTQIERHADTLNWQSLTLDSSQWPAIQLTLKAHVLSQSPRWGAP